MTLDAHEERSEPSGGSRHREEPGSSRFAPVHWLIITFWLVTWLVAVLVWWSDNRHGGGWVTEDAVAILAAIGYAGGAFVLAFITLVARTALKTSRVRSIVLIGGPALLVIWVLSFFS